MFSNPEKILMQFGISEGISVADFGCGTGFYALLLSQKVGDIGKVYAIDVNKDLLSRLSKDADKNHIDNIEVIWGDVEKNGGSTLKNDSVDVVLIANTLFSLEDKKGVANEAKRILNKKGRILLVEWSDSFAGMGPHRDHVVKEEEAKKIFVEAGFSFEKSLDAGEHHYGMVLRKE